MNPVQNAKDRPLFVNTGDLPQVGDTLLNYFQPMKFVRVVKEVVNFLLVETQTPLLFHGVWQPAGRRLIIDKGGQRKWKYYTVHSDTTLRLNPDEIITYLDRNFRVLDFDDYSLYGYFRYGLVEDFT